ncbi:MAG: hypothetical protein KDK50_02180 [Chlamydiia bacterium]|nr:hypothetical protein [Chlamydiia bacterium]MCP5491996.1 hypothetical protein [Chlamydiales bacterium]
MAKTKSEKVKKLEAELADLEHWLNLGLVPKKDMEKHKVEIASLKHKIEEEKGKLTETKEGAEPEEYIAPKRNVQAKPFSDGASIADVDVEEDASADEEEEIGTDDNYISDDDDDDDDTDELADTEEDEDDPFSDRNRWRRGVLEDPDSDNW